MSLHKAIEDNMRSTLRVLKARKGQYNVSPNTLLKGSSMNLANAIDDEIIRIVDERIEMLGIKNG